MKDKISDLNIFVGCGEFPVPVGAVDMTVFRGLYSSINLTCTDDYITTGSLDVKCENDTWDIGNFTCWWKGLSLLSIMCCCYRDVYR